MRARTAMGAPLAAGLLVFALLLTGGGLSPSLVHRALDVPPPIAIGAAALLHAPTSVRAPVPLLTPAYVLQQGIEFVEENGELGIPPAYLLANLTLPNTTLGTAWTLSGLSSTGDRYLVWAGYDIPYSGTGCPSSGYSLGYQVASSSGSQGTPQCVAGITPAQGDDVELGLNLDCGGVVGNLCLTLSDLTLSMSSSPAVSQPTATATYFQNAVPSQPNKYGYFTGVVTVVADVLAPSGCVVLSGLPTVSYFLQSFLPTDTGYLGIYLSEYQLFANETEPTGSVCGNAASSVETMPTTIQTEYFQGGGTSDGPHWLSVENWSSMIGGAASMGRFQTDAVPVTASMELNRTVADVGQLVHANVTASGGTGPYSCAWFVDGTPVAGTACVANLTITDTGTVNISALAIDAAGVNGLASALLTAFADPTLLAPVADPGSIDVGQPVEFMAHYSGGAGGLSYLWNVSLPSTDCSSLRAASLTCSPTVAGPTTVTVQLTDVLNATAISPPLIFTTRSDPVALLALAPGAPALLDVGGSTEFELNVSGGSGGDQYTWSLPLGPCAVAGSSATCRPDTAGRFSASASVTDSNGYSVASAPVSVVVDPDPTVTIVSPDTILTVGDNLTIALIVTGGQGPYSYEWGGLPGGCAPPSGPDLGCLPSAAGGFNITVNVSDALGGNASGRIAITVNPAPNASSGAGFPGGSIGIALAAVALAVVLALLLLWTRRRRQPPSPEGYVIVSGPTVRPPEGD